MSNQKDNLKRMAKVNRENRLAHEREVGRVRASTWGGKPSIKQDRQAWKQRNNDN